MRPWRSARGWTPRKSDYYRLDPIADDLEEYGARRRDRVVDPMLWLSTPAGLRWLVGPLVTVAILAVAAYFATFAARADEWLCTGTSICFDRAGIVYSNTDPGQMLVRATDIKTGEGGWIAVDCVARLATANSPVFTIEDGSPLGNLCDTIGSEE